MTNKDAHIGPACRRIALLREDSRGIALIMVLWVLAVLMVIVLSFSYLSRTESLAAVSFRQGVEKKFLAEAGIEKAVMEIFYRRTNPNVQTDIEGVETWRVDGTPYTVKIGDDHYTVAITDESGKINLNTLNDTSVIILKNLLANMGVEGPQADTIADSILDWKDPDDLVRLNGAESDYYMSLPNPYKAKNANFDTLEELSLVKGMTPAILYGDGTKKGIIDFLTMNSNSAQINVGAAPREVLMAIPGITPDVVDAIMNARENPVDYAAAMQGLTAVVTPPYNQFITQGMTGNVFSIESSGFKGDTKGGYTIKATVTIEGDNTFKYKYYKSPA
jgi:general secretion pathway protein K